MKVILLQDVKSIGKKGETKEVKDGYALNFLIPKRLAVKMTETSVKVLEQQNEAERIRQEKLKNIAEENKSKLESITLEFISKAAKDGRMIGTISYKEVGQKLSKEFGIDIDKRKIVDKYQINAFGVTNLKIELYKGVIATIKVHVSEEK